MTIDGWFTFFTWVGVAALAVGVICACAIAILGNVRDRSLKLALAASAERVALLNKQAAPRMIGQEFIAALEGQPKAAVEILYVRDATDGYSFSMQLFAVLSGAGWPVKYPEPILMDDTERAKKMSALPSATLACGQPNGITLVTSQKIERGSTFLDPVEIEKSATSFGALARAFMASIRAGSLVPTQVSFSAANTFPACIPVPDGTLRIVVAPKP